MEYFITKLTTRVVMKEFNRIGILMTAVLENRGFLSYHPLKPINIKPLIEPVVILKQQLVKSEGANFKLHSTTVVKM